MRVTVKASSGGLPAEEVEREPFAESFLIAALLPPGTPLGPDALTESVKTSQETLIVVQLLHHVVAAAKYLIQCYSYQPGSLIALQEP
jgi:hypothetical protein